MSSGSSARGGCGPMARSCRIAIDTGAGCPQVHTVRAARSRPTGPGPSNRNGFARLVRVMRTALVRILHTSNWRRSRAVLAGPRGREALAAVTPWISAGRGPLVLDHAEIDALHRAGTSRVYPREVLRRDHCRCVLGLDHLMPTAGVRLGRHHLRHSSGEPRGRAVRDRRTYRMVEAALGSVHVDLGGGSERSTGPGPREKQTPAGSATARVFVTTYAVTR